MDAPLEKIFVSYSRRNSDFTQEITKELLAAGCQLWFDQLHIKTGEAWDSSINKALDDADGLLLILSKASVASENVMDEISYALGEDKKIIPILIEKCDIPFRIKRLPIYDMTTDTAEGMRLLFHALKLEPNVQETSWDTLDEIKKAGTRPKNIYVSIDKNLWFSIRRISTAIVITLGAPIIAYTMHANAFQGFLGAWMYCMLFLVAAALSFGLSYILKKSKRGKRFLRKKESVLLPLIILLLGMIVEIGNGYAISAYFLIMAITVNRIPEYRDWDTHIAYYLNLIVLIIAPIFGLYYFTMIGVYDNYIMGQFVAIAILASIISFGWRYVSRRKWRFSNFFRKHAKAVFFYSILLFTIALEIKTGNIETPPLLTMILLAGGGIFYLTNETEVSIISAN